jgi:hypothetical protein
MRSIHCKNSGAKQNGPLCKDVKFTYALAVSFMDYLNAAADVMAAKFKGNRWQGQNPSDIGEIPEILTREFLAQFL